MIEVVCILWFIWMVGGLMGAIIWSLLSLIHPLAPFVAIGLLIAALIAYGKWADCQQGQ